MILEEKEMSAELTDHMRIIWSSGKLLEYNIQSQLSQMQIESDSYEINYVDCSRPELQELIKDVIKPFHMVITERNLTFQVNEQTTVPVSFYIEKKLYSEILYNLFQNAVKFNKPNGSIFISVRYEKQSGKLWTMIEDTGVGIDPKMKRNLFIAFRNATNEKNHASFSKSGIGIGLSNSKCLVTALAGEIHIQSKPDKGTIVTFSVDIVLKKEKPCFDPKDLRNEALNASLGQVRNKEVDEDQIDLLLPSDLAPEPPEFKNFSITNSFEDVEVPENRLNRQKNRN